MKLAIGSDHAGFDWKEKVKAILLEMGHEVTDFGTDSLDSVDYPDFAHTVSTKVMEDPASQGILICGTGIGMSMAANRHKEIRAALVTSEFMAGMAKSHNNANVLVLGARVSTVEECRKFVDLWLKTKFEGGRHERRVEKI